MSIEKKSLISTLKTTKKANIAKGAARSTSVKSARPLTLAKVKSAKAGQLAGIKPTFLKAD